MARPPKIIRPTRLELRLPEDLRWKLDSHLYSAVEHRIPLGAYQQFFVELLVEFFNRRES